MRKTIILVLLIGVLFSFLVYSYSTIPNTNTNFQYGSIDNNGTANSTGVYLNTGQNRSIYYSPIFDSGQNVNWRTINWSCMISGVNYNCDSIGLNVSINTTLFIEPKINKSDSSLILYLPLDEKIQYTNATSPDYYGNDAYSPASNRDPSIETSRTFTSNDSELYKEELSINSFYVEINDSGTVYANNGSNILKSTDFGETWVSLFVAKANGRELFIDSRNTLFASVNDVGAMYMSKGNDTNWTVSLNFTLFSPCAENSTLWNMDENSSGSLFVGEYTINTQGSKNCANIYRSGDNGTTWSMIYNSTKESRPGRHIHFVAVDPYTDYIYAGQGDDDAQAGLLRSIDGGTTWSYIQTGVDFSTSKHSQYNTIQFTQNYRILGEDSTGIVRTSDDSTFTHVYTLTGINSGAWWQSLKDTNGNLYFGSVGDSIGEHGIMVKSSDNGTTWERVYNSGRQLDTYSAIVHISNHDNVNNWFYVSDRDKAIGYRMRDISSRTRGENVTRFDGKANLVQVKYDDVLHNLTTNLTISIWIKPYNMTTNDMILFKGTGTAQVQGGFGYYLRFQGTNGRAIQLVTGNGAGSFNNALTANIISPYKWYHIIATANTTTQEIWVDGNLSKTISVTNIALNNTADFTIGGDTTAGKFCNCSMAHLAVYNQVLNSTIIKGMYNGTFYTNATNQSTTNYINLPEQTINDLSESRYIQYRILLEGNGTQGLGINLVNISYYDTAYNYTWDEITQKLTQRDNSNEFIRNLTSTWLSSSSSSTSKRIASNLTSSINLSTTFSIDTCITTTLGYPPNTKYIKSISYSSDLGITSYTDGSCINNQKTITAQIDPANSSNIITIEYGYVQSPDTVVLSGGGGGGGGQAGNETNQTIQDNITQSPTYQLINENLRDKISKLLNRFNELPKETRILFGVFVIGTLFTFFLRDQPSRKIFKLRRT